MPDDCPSKRCIYLQLHLHRAISSRPDENGILPNCLDSDDGMYCNGINLQSNFCAEAHRAGTRVGCQELSALKNDPLAGGTVWGLRGEE